ncbi:DUF3817 domain-containing protein [Chitinophaga pendula]|uniref:DUF3817 domain-containing protein n=1 Tax=Chitinophaga TaxID=79328 RepID=UPI000BAFF6E9|nr:MULTISPECIES: DUF3817 domain-containing protein [Chitinophaga]ASZ13990.1 hypothetical protein CK934_25065 [Chitinophaga sp. MD30]UCJ08386.1 DUF3817 domain-containing protein [Chitinophaga pendula]
MFSLVKTQVGRLRIIAFLEGMSLLLLLFVAVPMKYIWHDAAMVKALGPVHGILFLLFIYGAISVGVVQRWKFTETTWKVLLACIIPFGTFYVDYKILKYEVENGE